MSHGTKSNLQYVMDSEQYGATHPARFSYIYDMSWKRLRQPQMSIVGVSASSAERGTDPVPGLVVRTTRGLSSHNPPRTARLALFELCRHHDMDLPRGKRSPQPPFSTSRLEIGDQQSLTNARAPDLLNHECRAYVHLPE